MSCTTLLADLKLATAITKFVKALECAKFSCKIARQNCSALFSFVSYHLDYSVQFCFSINLFFAKSLIKEEMSLFQSLANYHSISKL